MGEANDKQISAPQEYRKIGYQLMGELRKALEGIEVYSDTIDVFSGWNLIGSLTNSVPVNNIETVPSGIISGGFFGYNDSYYQTDTLKPFMDYWVKMSQDGQLILSSPIK